MPEHSLAYVEEIPIADITVPDGRRPVGVLSGLMGSITEVGLLHPIVVSPEGTLIAGGRRLAACRALGWETIPANRIPLLEMRARTAEIDENAERAELTPAQQAEQRQERATLHARLRQGGLSYRQIAEKTGASLGTVERDVEKATVPGGTVQPERIVGADGKSRPATMPKPAPAPVEEWPRGTRIAWVEDGREVRGTVKWQISDVMLFASVDGEEDFIGYDVCIEDARRIPPDDPRPSPEELRDVGLAGRRCAACGGTLALAEGVLQTCREGVTRDAMGQLVTPAGPYCSGCATARAGCGEAATCAICAMPACAPDPEAIPATAPDAPPAYAYYKRDADTPKTADEDVRQPWDNCQTPGYAIDPLLPYLPPGVVWEPARGEGLLVEAFHDAGREVVSSDITTGENFFEFLPGRWDVLVTNPPYSLKFRWLEWCYALGRPFALLLPVETLGAKAAQVLFEKHGVQVMFLDKRINFKMPVSGWRSSAPFPVAWFTWCLGLPSQIVFAKVKPDADSQ